MARLDVRCKVRIPVRVRLWDRNEEIVLETVMRDISLHGALLSSSLSLEENKTIWLEAYLPDFGECVLEGRVIRKGADGVAIHFVNIDEASKTALWNFLKGKVSPLYECPYCGNPELINGRCDRCGLSTDIKHDQFLQRHEEEVVQWCSEYLDNATDELIAEMEKLETVLEQSSPQWIIKRIREIIDEFIEKAKRIEYKIHDKSILRELRMRFQQRTDHIFSRSYLFNRVRTWPQGYQGDYKTLETIYRAMPLSKGLGYYFDYIAINSTLGQAVRNRIKRVETYLKEELMRRKSPRILNIACGSCRELVKIAPEISSSRARITCIDNDEDALAFAYSRLSYTGAIAFIDFRKYNALRMFDHEMNQTNFEPQDVIYSVGFFDYLQSDFLVKMFNSLYKLLKPGGRLIAAFKDAERYRPQCFHWLADWDGFLQRTETDFIGILKEAEIPMETIRTEKEDTGAIIFYLIDKKI